MSKRTGEFLCVVCPNGCVIEADFTIDKPPKLLSATGQKCARGDVWIRQEIENPMRTFSSSVLVKNGRITVASVRVTRPVPLNKVMEVMREIRSLNPEAPLRIGQVLLSAPAGTDTEVIVTRNVDRA